MAKVDLSKFNNDWYSPGSKLRLILWFIIGNLFVNSYAPIPMKLKIIILRLFGAKLGANLVLKPKINIKYPWLLQTGSNVWIGEKVWIDNLDKVTIEDNVCISQGAYLLTGNHDYTKETFDLITGPIVLKESTWIGAQAVVCPGVTCQEGSILSVASVTSKDLEKNGIYRGNPAILLKYRGKEES